MSKVKIDPQNIRDKQKSVSRHIEIDNSMSISEIAEIVTAKDGCLESARIYYESSVDWCEAVNVTLYLTFDSPETDEEWQQRLRDLDEFEARDKQMKIEAAAKKKAGRKARQEEERAEYERLKAKFEKSKK